MYSRPMSRQVLDILGRRPRIPRIPRIPRRRGRVLAVKWGLNPNSSSLGVDVTFLLFGAAALSMVTPVVSALLRFRRPQLDSANTSGADADDIETS